MIDRLALDRGAVRKYWLAQDFARGVALDDIERVEFADGDVHRLTVAWKSGARVWVNRGEKDWTVEGRTLPQYGFLARSGGVESSVEKIGGVIVEQARGASSFYVNARSFDPDPPLRIRPSAERVEHLGGRKFKMIVHWSAEAPAPKDLRVLTLFGEPPKSRLVKTEFQAGGAPKPGTSQWKGTATTGQDWIAEVPEDWKPGRYDIFAALVDPKGNQRVRLLGDEASARRYRIGALAVEGQKGNITNIGLDKSDVKPPAPSRLNLEKAAVDFGPAVTEGAFRCEVQPEKIVLTPLPDGDPFSLTLRLDRLAGGPRRVQSIEALDINGSKVRQVPFEARNNAITFQTERGEFAYHAR